MFMKNTKFTSGSLEKIKSTSLDAEAVKFWGEQAKFQRSCMDEVAAYLG
jgi:hypothetical protein